MKQPLNNEQRKEFFDLLCRNSSPDFIENLRVYEKMPRPLHESFEISCELVNGVRADKMRVAIMCLYRKEVLAWLLARSRQEELNQEILFDNPSEDCFGVGLADYAPGLGDPRIKIYNTYGEAQPLSRVVEHIQRLFVLYNIPDVDFKKDLENFKKIRVSGVDLEGKEQTTIKVYFGPFTVGLLLGDHFKVLSREEVEYFNNINKKDPLPVTFYFCVKYSNSGRILRTEMRYRSKDVLPHLRMFDERGEVEKALAEYYQILPYLTLEYVCVEFVPIQKLQFYFFVGENPRVDIQG